MASSVLPQPVGPQTSVGPAFRQSAAGDLVQSQDAGLAIGVDTFLFLPWFIAPFYPVILSKAGAKACQSCIMFGVPFLAVAFQLLWGFLVPVGQGPGMREEIHPYLTL